MKTREERLSREGGGRYPHRSTECIFEHKTGPFPGCSPTKERQMEDRQGCWDGYGQTGADYDTKAALNMRAIMRMIETVSGRNASTILV